MKFSIVIPTYNREKLILKALKSIQAQTFEDFEVLVIDNGSTDNTGEVIASLGDERFQYHWQEGTGGPASPRNNGIRLSKAQWLCFLDSDDWWEPNKLEVIANSIAKNPDVDIFCHHEFLVDENEDVVSILEHGKNHDVSDLYRELLLKGTCFSPSAVAMKSDFLRDSAVSMDETEELNTVEDYDFWLNLANKGIRAGFIKEPLGSFYVAGQNLSSDVAHKDKVINLYRRHAFDVQSICTDKQGIFNRLKADYYFRRAIGALRKKQVLSFVKDLFASIALDFRVIPRAIERYRSK